MVVGGALLFEFATAIHLNNPALDDALVDIVEFVFLELKAPPAAISLAVSVLKLVLLVVLGEASAPAFVLSVHANKVFLAAEHLRRRLG